MVQSNIEYVQKEFKGKVPQQLPSFYITYGPPASGKGGIMKKVMERDNVSQDTVIDVVIDDIVMSTPGYKEERDKLIASSADKQKLQDLYWSTRKVADNISDALLNTALLGKYNIVWETNGRTIAWTIKEIKRIQHQNYNTVVVYPWVPIYSKINGQLGTYTPEQLKNTCPHQKQILPGGTGLLDRAVWREVCFGQEAAPADQIIRDAKLAQNNIIKLLNIVDKVYLYDNSGSYGEEKLIFSIENIYDWTSDLPPTELMLDQDNTMWASPGHKYKIHCFMSCEDIEILDSKGMEQELVDTLNKFCCEPTFIEEF